MKKKIFLICILIVFLVMPTIVVYADENDLNYKPNVTLKYKKDDQKTLDDVPQIGCKAAYVVEPDTGKIIYEKNAHEKMYPASTTKILTALVVMEKCELTEKAVVSQRALSLVPEGYSNAGLQVGEEHTIETLLYALLLPSANEAANVLAEHVSGSVEDFVELCNTRAKELGCETLHFVNTNGIHDSNHYCSAYDLYLIAKECRKYDIFNKIVKTKSFTVPATKIHPASDRIFKNTNELLQSGKYYYAYCTGIKTGHTTQAGECLVASSSYNNIELISVVLGGKELNSSGYNERFYDTKQLYEFIYDNYSIKDIANYGDVVAEINVGKATEETKKLDVMVDTDISTIIPNSIDKDNIKISISIDENIVAPIEKNQVLGKITYNADGLVYTTNLIASHSVEKIPYGIYNIIVVSVIGVILLIFIILKSKFKKRRKIVFIIKSIILIIIGISMIFIIQEGNKKSITEINILEKPRTSEEIEK